MTQQITGQRVWLARRNELIFMGFVGLFLGLIGAAVNHTLASVVTTAVLMGILGAYNQVLRHNQGIISGIFAGCLLGIFIAIVSLILGGNIQSPSSGALFGLIRGLMIGSLVGFMTRAEADKSDPWSTHLFLFIGSCFLGALLGAINGLIAGLFLGIITSHAAGYLITMIAGGIFGGYLGSYFQSYRIIAAGIFGGALLAFASFAVGDTAVGIIMGGIGGAFAPMIWVAMIGAYGGLSSRGFRAMVIEAMEAPSEMLMQGAVPFLVPAMMVGILMGAAGTGLGGVIALPFCMALTGLILGVFGEIERRPNYTITTKNIVEMVIIGNDTWPVRRALRQLRGKNRKTAVLGASVGLIVGLTGCILGILLGQWLIPLAQQAM